MVALFFLLLFYYYFNFFIFNNLFFLFHFNNFILFFSFFFFLLILLSLVADRVLVLWPGVTPEPLRWESQVQDIGPPETSCTHVISNSESSPKDLHLNTKTQLHSTTRKL